MGQLDPAYRPSLESTVPVVNFGPFPSWFDPKKIVTIDPWGAEVYNAFRAHFDKGYDIRPTIAVTKAHVELPEVREAIREGRLVPDGQILLEDGQSHVTKAAIEPTWFLPGVAERFGVSEDLLRESIFRETNGMYPELLSRPDIKVNSSTTTLEQPIAFPFPLFFFFRKQKNKTMFQALN